MTRPNAVRNFAISSRVPIVTRTWFGSADQVRPITTFSFSIAPKTSRPGRRASIMIMLASEGITSNPFF